LTSWPRAGTKEGVGNHVAWALFHTEHAPPCTSRETDTAWPDQPLRREYTAANYKKDKLYLPVARAVHSILQRGQVVTPIDVLIEMQRVTNEQVEDWRFGRIP